LEAARLRIQQSEELTADSVEERLSTFADQQAGIDHKAFHDCVDRGLTVGPVMKDEELGRKEGVHATPTIFINGTRVEGIRDAAQLKQLIASARSGNLAATLVNTPQPSGTQGNACALAVRKGGNDGFQ
jgi:protein-disulfide isomerase